MPRSAQPPRDAPQMTIRDAGNDVGWTGDVLEAGRDDERPGHSRRSRALTIAALVAAAAFVGGQLVLQERAEQRDRAFAVADRVRLVATVEAVFAGPGDGYLQAHVLVTVEKAGRVPDRVTAVRIEGPGLVPLPFRPPAPGFPPYHLLPEATVDCSGELPAYAEFVVVIVPASGRPHEQRLRVGSEHMYDAVRLACRPY